MNVTAKWQWSIRYRRQDGSPGYLRNGASTLLTAWASFDHARTWVRSHGYKPCGMQIWRQF